jgi:hypothetical protein
VSREGHPGKSPRHRRALGLYPRPIRAKIAGVRPIRLAILFFVLAACGSEEAPRPRPKKVVRFAEGTQLGRNGGAILDFGTVAPGRQARASLVVENLTDRSLALSVDEPEPPFSLVDAPAEIAPGSPASLVFRYAPTAEAESAQTIRLRAGGQTLRVRLAGRGGNGDTDCALRVRPESLRLNVGPASVPWRVPLDLEVEAGRCVVEEVRAEGDLELAVEELVGKVLPEGTRYLVHLEVGAAEPGSAGELVLDHGDGELRLPIEIVAEPACVGLDLTELHFEEGLGCEKSTEIRFENSCDDPVELVSVTLVPKEAERFFEVDPTEGGVMVRYRAEDVLGVAYAQAILDFDNGDRLYALLAGRVLVAEQRIVIPETLVDLLIVIDKNSRMADFEGLLDELAARIASWITSTDKNVAVGVTTTLTDGSTDCVAEAGRLLPLDESRPRVLDRDTSDLESVLRANLDVERCAPPGAAHGLNAARLAVQGAAEGWSRDLAKKAILVVATEDDPTLSGDLPLYRGALEKEGVAWFHAIGPDPSCGEGWNYAFNYRWMAMDISGLFRPICDERPLDAILGELERVTPPVYEFELDRQSVADASGFGDEAQGIYLLLDGVPIPSTGSAATPAWTVAGDGAYLRVNRGFPPGTELTLRYPPLGSTCP